MLKHHIWQQQLHIKSMSVLLSDFLILYIEIFILPTKHSNYSHGHVNDLIINLQLQPKKIHFKCLHLYKCWVNDVMILLTNLIQSFYTAYLYKASHYISSTQKYYMYSKKKEIQFIMLQNFCGELTCIIYY